ncbi:MAG: hypothetical protein KTR16_02405 [Acidiferrobacterales bacterium]|nr:hypothetical protein [Acidiferrobacterales bacterium]
MIILSGCVGREYPDLSHYSLEDFKNEVASCNFKSQCKYIGYGIGSGGCTGSPIYEDFIVYSTKYGKSNIEHLTKLAAESRNPYSAKQTLNSSLLMNVQYELEECLPIGNLKPIMQCVENICLNTAGTEI